GAEYSSGEYGWTTNLKRIKESVKWQLECLQTDYIDFGFIHCIDEEQDLKTIQENGVLDYILDLKKKGIIHYIGLSSHSPKLVHQVLDMKILDVVMFSINPAYDLKFGDFAIGEFDERMDLYRRLEKEGVGISVMKAFCGGKLLDADESPFHQALTETQCMQYALDKPAVLTVLPGIRNEKDLIRILHYLEASDEEKDYSILGTFPKLENYNQCVYCKHCHPCPKGLDIALINKYYDLARLGDELAADHYHHLALKASDCIVCHHCDKRCPFHVQQSKRMQEIADYFHE
ncbi:MAG: aldo/keto reductase, partial [Coprobacillus sp.]|nr:aldo/keto reductase [Coprobacillus sp.]